MVYLLYILIILVLLLRISYFSFFLQEKSNQNETFFVTKKKIPWPNKTCNKPSNVLQWFPNLGANSYILFLILVSTLHFSERKNW